MTLPVHFYYRTISPKGLQNFRTRGGRARQNRPLITRVSGFEQTRRIAA
jgi:hypothetical protein